MILHVTIMEGRSYVCVSGQCVSIPEDIEYSVQRLDKTKWDNLITCPITHEYYTDPVVIIASGNTYDRAAIIHWLSSHDKDPLTNIVIKDTHIVPNNALKSFLYRIEKSGNSLLFHDFECCYQLNQFQSAWQRVGPGVDPTYYKFYKSMELLIGGSVAIDVSVDYVTTKRIIMKLPERIKDKKDVFLTPGEFVNEYPEKINIIPRPKYALKGPSALLVCPVSGLPLITPTIAANGITYSRGLLDMYNSWLGTTSIYTISGYRLYHELMPYGELHHDHMCDNIIVRQIVEMLGVSDQISEVPEVNFKERIDQEINIYYDRLYSYKQANSEYLKNQYAILRPYANTKKVTWRKIKNARDVIAGKHNEIVLLSEKARVFIIKNKDKFYHNSNKITRLRKELELPHLNEESVYGTDLSFLDLSFMIIYGTNFKDFSFSCANLTSTKFINCQFSHCNFYGTILLGSTFMNCEFSSDVSEAFYKCVGVPEFK